jgi:hypothetical protein
VYNIITGKTRSSAFRGKKQNEASLSGSDFMNFNVKKQFLAKKSRTVMRTVKKSKMYLLIPREREDISQKFQRILIQHAKSILSK